MTTKIFCYVATVYVESNGKCHCYPSKIFWKNAKKIKLFAQRVPWIWSVSFVAYFVGTCCFENILWMTLLTRCWYFTFLELQRTQHQNVDSFAQVLPNVCLNLDNVRIWMKNKWSSSKDCWKSNFVKNKIRIY